METSPLPVMGYKITTYVRLRAFEQAGIFIVPNQLWHGASVFPVSSNELAHSVEAPLTTQKGVWRAYFNPNPHGYKHTQRKRGYAVLWGYISDRLMTRADNGAYTNNLRLRNWNAITQCSGSENISCNHKSHILGRQTYQTAKLYKILMRDII
jgi:hypothetical protein